MAMAMAMASLLFSPTSAIKMTCHVASCTAFSEVQLCNNSRYHNTLHRTRFRKTSCKRKHLWSLRAVVTAAASASPSSFSSESTYGSGDGEREERMPVPGTITFRRSSTQTHYEYLTDLETLGMESFSSDLSRSVSLSMGVQPAPDSLPSTTPVAVSIDVSKEGRDLRLDGIVRTSIALNCRSCGIPVGERVFGEFSLLLTEKPVVEPSKQQIGVVLGNAGRIPNEHEDIEELLDLDLDDKMYFPRMEKSIDISKYIRDTVHLEMPLQCLCNLSCQGKCFDCGVNLNQTTCKCKKDTRRGDSGTIWGPLDQLKKQLENEGLA